MKISKEIVILGIASIALLVVFTLPASAIYHNKDADLQSRKDTQIARIDSAVTKLNNLETKITANSNIDDATKSAVLADLNEVGNYLLAHKDKVNAATTEAELQALNQTLLQYLAANKNVLREAVQAALVGIGSSAKQKAEEFKQGVNKLLTVLKLTCPDQKSTIATLESQLAQLETGIAALNAAIQAKDSTAIKAETAALNTLMKSMAANALAIQEACL